MLGVCALATAAGCGLRERAGEVLASEAEAPAPAPARPPSSVAGRLALSLHGPGAGAAAPVRQRSVWVVDPGYAGMEDNDLRGFLDGRFIYGWNQPGQVHTRAGRRGSSPRWGEPELFRTLQRWTGVVLPEDARVLEAELALHVEEGPDRPLTVMLYAVHGDWQPGQGGTPRNNNAPPEPGDVWWNARAEGVRSWGLPGLGLASDTAPDADTPAQPLAEARWEPGDTLLRFASEPLARYAEARATRGRPLGFLVKLADPLEDEPDTVLAIRSASADDLRNPSRRPRLTLLWEDAAPKAAWEGRVHLEPGRELALPRLHARGATLAAAGFRAEEGHEAPTILVRGGREGEAGSAWQPLAATRPADWSWIEARVLAARRPVELGEAFETRLRDTWIRSAPPESQAVPFTFVSPQGEVVRVMAEYAGDFTWTVRFEPSELGRWRYVFESSFLKHPRTSAVGSFDVVAGDEDSVRRALDALLARARAAEPPDGGMGRLAQAFWKLERAALARESAEDWRGAEGEALRAKLAEVREALSGRHVPHEVVPKPMDRDW